MKTLPERSAVASRALGKVSLGIVVLSGCCWFLMDPMGFYALLFGAVLALIALAFSIAAMIQRSRCLVPRPIVPALSVLASLAALSSYVGFATVLASFAGMGC
jgi:hypothetical protein